MSDLGIFLFAQAIRKRMILNLRNAQFLSTNIGGFETPEF